MGALTVPDGDERKTLRDIRVEARRERVKRLLARRLTTGEMAEALGVSERTIEYDVAAIREEMATSLSRMDALSVAGTVLNRGEARQRELWTMLGQLKATDVSTINAKVAILRELRAESKEEVELLQKLGIVYQAPRDVRLGIQALAALQAVPEADLSRIATLPQPQFLKALAEVLGEEVVEALIEPGPEEPE